MICVIPARGGSQRFPGKNIAPLFGQPVINRTIDICLESGLFSKVIVSTDSTDIALKVNVMADIQFRPDHLCGDSSETDVLKNVMETRGEPAICRVYPFNALLTKERLERGYKEFIGSAGINTVLECVEYPHPIERAITDKGFLTPEFVMSRTQDLPVRYHDAGSFMYTTRSALDLPLPERTIRWIAVSQLECQDVDTAEDFEMLKMKFARMYA